MRLSRDLDIVPDVNPNSRSRRLGQSPAMSDSFGERPIVVLRVIVTVIHNDTRHPLLRTGFRILGQFESGDATLCASSLTLASVQEGFVSISLKRVVLSGLIAGPIELVLKIIEGGLYLQSLFREAIEPVNPAWMANVVSASGRNGFLLIMLLLGVVHMYIYAAMRPRFDTRLATVVSAALAAGIVEALNWGIVGLIGIFTWWHICVEATLTIGNMLIAVYAGSMIYKDAPAGLRS